ncbi:Beta-glucan synthesis-associated protein KRE6 [Candida viswanathii]|uniref:Beta-glucan synthesis-associated protein KRE6 n=1 Tax=Candida viswanathii TaxID=5486 RepID=A0A367XV70_9ASCO|nr:Beta-glucan synthesis-associated protein KRE6 [Candida viswanathii]
MSRRDLTHNTNGENSADNAHNSSSNTASNRTSNTDGNYNRQSYPLFTNPFEGGEAIDHNSSFYLEDRSNSNFTSSSTVSSASNPDLVNQYGRPFTVNTGYSSDGSTSYLLHGPNNTTNTNSNLQSPRLDRPNVAPSSSSSGPSKGSYVKPTNYDRYPKIAVSSSFSSSSINRSNGTPFPDDSATGSASSLPNNHNGDANQKKTYGDYFDISPFGGYPASSFPLNIDEKEPDDYLHNPDPIEDEIYEKHRFWNDLKTADRKSSFGLLGFLFLLAAGAAVFVVLPVLTYSGVTTHERPEHHEILTHYSYPMLGAIRQTLVDPDTPEDALTMSAKDGSDWVLVFSDEFNAEGRTFYEGDDQFFTAPDIHYDATKDLEWYDPDAASTANGTLNLRMDAYKSHDLFYRSGMVQSWNKMCFTQGKIVISARLPNKGTVSGLWPGLWTMGNLGRPGYLASTEGVWPYSYDSCDAGITPNQSSPDGISYLPGQRLNSCTCPGESHPNPGVGRGAPEIDVIEAEVSTDTTARRENIGVASQSLQLAPMDIWYYPDYSFLEIYNDSVTTMNTYTGGPFQQALSGTTTLNKTWYELGNNEHNFQTYGYEYLNDNDEGYLRWFVGEDPTLTVYARALHPNGNIGWRLLSKEPMSMIFNLGVSKNWAYIDWPSLVFPTTFRIDYVRVYQPKDQINVGCDPDDFPTHDYIEKHWNIYHNANLTNYEDGGYDFPRNQLIGC